MTRGPSIVFDREREKYRTKVVKKVVRKGVHPRGSLKEITQPDPDTA